MTSTLAMNVFANANGINDVVFLPPQQNNIPVIEGRYHLGSQEIYLLEVWQTQKRSVDMTPTIALHTSCAR
jgi:hypothetical protein